MRRDDLLPEYFYRKLTRLDEKEDELIRAMRTKRGMYLLCDQLKTLAIEKRIVQQIHDELLPFWQ